MKPPQEKKKAATVEVTVVAGVNPNDLGLEPRWELHCSKDCSFFAQGRCVLFNQALEPEPRWGPYHLRCRECAVAAGDLEE